MSQPEDITRLLHLAEKGDREAESRLLQLLSGELRRLAASYLRRERPNHTLQPTALVHEAYLRLSGGRPHNWSNRAHFLAAAAQAMRHVLVDCARSRTAKKRGSEGMRVQFDTDLTASKTWVEEMLDVDFALNRLADFDPRPPRVVQLRSFSGLPDALICVALGISGRTVKREWECARAWLHGELTRAPRLDVPGARKAAAGT